VYDNVKTSLTRVARNLSTTTLLVDIGDATYAMHYDAQSSLLSTKKIWPLTEPEDGWHNLTQRTSAWLLLAGDVAAVTRSQAAFFDALQGES
jgi:hypothetical protein